MEKQQQPEVQQRPLSAAEAAMIKPEPASGEYQFPETRELVSLVKDAAALVRAKGEAAFGDLGQPGSRWRQGETYIFVLDKEGNMLVHADPQMEGKNQINLRDIKGKPIIEGLLAAATGMPDKPGGWYHYQWPTPGGLLPRWKSSYVQRVEAPSGKSYIIGSGMYNDRMEREFIVDLVRDAVRQIERREEAAFELFRDPTGPFRVKDAYIFVMDMNGVERLNPAFPNLEGSNLLDFKDTQGKYLNREIIQLVQARGSGWIDYMWPKPGEGVAVQKSTYVSKASLDGVPVVVGCGVYLANAPKAVPATSPMSAADLVALVREAAALLAQKGEEAFAELKQKGSKWLHDDLYFWVWSMDGVRVLHPGIHTVNPETEGKDVTGARDLIGKPYGKMFLETAASTEGEGWVHCVWPKPFDVFPTWKSCFVKRVTFPSGKQYLTGSGVYDLQVDKAIIEDVVNRAAVLVAERGREAFPLLRDNTGPFVFMDVYVFVDTPDGVELVNPAYPSLEGRNLLPLADAAGNLAARDYIDAAINKGSAWVDYHWYKPGENTPVLKHTFVRTVQHGAETYIVGSGFYREEGFAGSKQKEGIRKVSWQAVRQEQLSDRLQRQVVSGEKATLARLSAKRGAEIARHYHGNEEYMWVLTGAMKYIFDDSEVQVNAGEVLVVPSNTPHAIIVLEDASFAGFFAPVREDWLRGEDQYLRQ